MALPSAFTVGSVACIVAAGVGLAAWSSADDTPQTRPNQMEQVVAPVESPTSAATPDRKPPARTKKSADTPDRSGSDRSERRDQRKRPKPDVVPEVLVEVFNNSGISGLAAETAATLQGAGWNVATTDNWYGAIPETTVYFPDGMRAEARKLASTLQASRVRPAVAPMQFDRLTAILTG